jgi:hypothetical protein
MSDLMASVQFLGIYCLCSIGGGAAIPNRTFIQPGAFDPEAIGAMIEAFDAACEKLGDIDQPEVAREVIAGRIIARAKLGSATRLAWWQQRSADRTR